MAGHYDKFLVHMSTCSNHKINLQSAKVLTVNDVADGPSPPPVVAEVFTVIC